MRGTFLLPDQADAGDPISQLEKIARLRDREAATREVLEIISRSPDDERPVFEAILGKALHLCGAMSAGLVLGHAGGPPQRLVAHLNSHAEVIEMYDAGLIPMDPERSAAARAIVSGEVIHLKDMGASQAYHSGIPHVRRMVDDHGVRTNLLVPLMGKDGGIGALILYKQKVAPFSDDEIALVQSFSAQAVIAIENVRQFRTIQTANLELEDRLEREAATSEILQVISQSRDDEMPVFEVILRNAARLCESPMARLHLATEDRQAFEFVASWGDDLRTMQLGERWPMSPDLVIAQTITQARSFHVENLAEHPGYLNRKQPFVQLVEEDGLRTRVTVPLVSKGVGIGSITLSRREHKPFAESDIRLVETFAAQAVIAIENVRQFRELQNRLAREAATREILEVISRHPDDEQPVFDAIIESAARLCDAPFAGLMLRNDPDTHLVVAASKTTNSGYIEMLRENPHSLADPNSLTVEAVKAMQVRQYPDIEALENYELPSDQLKITWDLERMRTLLYVPLIKGDRAIGTLVLWRQEVNEFSEDDIELLKIFAAQAVIAIENVRQFRELQTRLEREAATREILSVISQSRDDEKPVFDTILECATRLIGSPFAGMHMQDKTSGMVRMVAHVGLHAKTIEAHDFSAPIDEPVIVARAIKECAVMHRPDLTEGSLYAQRHPLRVAMVDVEGARTALVVPLVSDGAGIGCIWVFRRELRPYQEDEIALLQSFAAQAVIAIENVHQFREVQERLQREKAMSDVLSVISKSRDDEQPVFDVIVERARVLCKADISSLILGHEGGPPQRAVAQSGVSEQMLNAYRDGHFPMDPELSAGAKAIIERRVVLMEDAANDEIYHRGGSDRQEAVLRERIRSNLHVPLISDGKGIGCLVLARMEVRPYLPEEIALSKPSPPRP